jgi:hypothetical protein
VAAVLQGQRLALLKRFNAIASKRENDSRRKRRPDPAAKWAKVKGLASLAGGANSPTAEFSQATLQADELIADLYACRLIVDLKVMVDNPVRCPPPHLLVSPPPPPPSRLVLMAVAASSTASLRCPASGR